MTTLIYEITLDREEFEPFHYKANLAALKISIRNLTDRTKYLRGVAWYIDGPESDGQHDVDVLRRRVDIERMHPGLVGVIGPRDSITGWAVAALPHPPTGGIGGFTLEIEDEVGTRYRLRRDRRGDGL